MNIADKIKIARNRAGMSQQELADRLHVSRSAVAKWESDKGLPDIENLKAISGIFGMTLDELVGNNEDVVCTLREPLAPDCKPEDAVRSRWPDAVRIDRMYLQHDFGLAGRIFNILTFGWIGSLWRAAHYSECYTEQYFLVDSFDEHLFVSIREDTLYITPLGRRVLRSERDTFRHEGRTYLGTGKIKLER